MFFKSATVTSAFAANEANKLSETIAHPIAEVIPNLLFFIPVLPQNEISSMCRLTEINCIPQPNFIGSRFNEQKALQSRTDIRYVTRLYGHLFLQINGGKRIHSLQKLRTNNFQVGL